MKKAKQWIQKHKKEIIVGALAAGGTAAYFLIKDKKNKGLKAGVHLIFEFINGDEDADFYGLRSKSDVYTSLNLHKPGLTVGDLGKLGEELKKNIPSLTDDLPINHLSANYNIIRK